MKSFTIASFVALASVATAQLDNIPSCALNCFVGPLTSDGCESLTDFECHCKNGPALLSQVQPCVQGACSESDQKAAISAVESTCQQAGVPIQIPDSSAAPSAASSAVASASAAVSSVISEVVSSVAASASSALESAASSVAASSVAEPSTTATVSATVSETETSVVVVPTPTGDDDNESAAATSTLAEFTGGAAQATQAVGILGAAALAMLAL